MPSPFSTIVGSLLGLCSGASFTLNVVILIVLLRSKLPRNNPIYLLSALNLFSDCLQNAGILFFLTPTSIAQDYLLDLAKPNEPIWIVFMFVFQLQWYAAILILIAISVNRLIAVVFPAKSHLINREAVLWTCASIFPLSLLLTMIADFLLPCCRTNYSFATYSYQFFAWKPDYNETGVNYKNVLLDLPLNIGASAILFFCYGIIFLKVLESNRKEVVRKSMEMGQKNRRMGEIRYAIQFGLMSAFFIAAWVSFRIFPAIVPANQPQWYSLTAFFVIGNCSANALIYMTMNQEVKNLLLNSMRRVLGLPSLSTVMTSQFPQQQPSKGPTPPIGLAAISSTIVQPLAGTENGAKMASLTTPKWASRVGTARRK